MGLYRDFNKFVRKFEGKVKLTQDDGIYIIEVKKNKNKVINFQTNNNINIYAEKIQFDLKSKQNHLAFFNKTDNIIALLDLNDDNGNCLIKFNLGLI